MRKVTQTMKVATAVCELTGRGWMKFNDKLKDGRRSLKVFGWDYNDYKSAEMVLKVMGCEVEFVAFRGYNTRGGSNYTQYRLHVKEA